MNVKSLGYIGIASNRLAEWRAYCTGFLGLMDVSREADDLRFRMDDLGWRIKVRAGEKEDLVFVGFDARNQETLDAVCLQLAELGFETRLDEALALERQVSVLYTTQDPDGLQVELYVGATETAEKDFVSPRGVSGFLTGDQGLGHAVLFATDTEQKLRFYVNGLGFRLSDTILIGGQVTATFLHCNPRHHTVAIVQAPVRKHLNHFMLQVNSLNDVGYALDRAQDQGIKITSGLGCHTNDRMVSFYSRTPSGFEVEYGFGARVVDDDWSVAHHNAPSIWGHRSLSS